MGVFTGKTAVVTGASSGIGRAIALRLGEAGAHVFATGRQPAARPPRWPPTCGNPARSRAWSIG
jgi:NAD(P)-dependent dehydrogenase (short-subunit alcohol dehydrogenase family)